MSNHADNFSQPNEADSEANERDRADMERLVAGHEAALNDLMERHAQKLFHYLIRQLHNEAEAADIAEEAFVRLYQNRLKFDPRRKFSTWLYAIATNLSRDLIRFRSRHPQISIEAQEHETGRSLHELLPDTVPNPSECLQAAERAQAVRQAVAALPEDLRTPLLLSEYEDFSHSEIGVILKCTPKAVETRIYRARQRLREALAQVFSATS